MATPYRDIPRNEIDNPSMVASGSSSSFLVQSGAEEVQAFRNILSGTDSDGVQIRLMCYAHL